MSMVRPRPVCPELVLEFEGHIAGYGHVHDIPPGVTGLARTQGNCQTDRPYKLGHDLQYIANWSSVLDCEIMVRSLLVVAR